jgi:hypothetical protein
MRNGNNYEMSGCYAERIANIEKIDIGLSFIIFIYPISISDIILGFSNETCLQVYGYYLHITMEDYLIISGIIEFMISIYNISLYVQIYELMWNIIGLSLLYSCTCYKMYLFITIVFKLVISFVNTIKY